MSRHRAVFLTVTAPYGAIHRATVGGVVARRVTERACRDSGPTGCATWSPPRRCGRARRCQRSLSSSATPRSNTSAIYAVPDPAAVAALARPWPEVTPMSALRTAAEDYLAMRRALGFKLGLQGRLLMQFVDYLEGCGLETVTAEAAIAWATAPSGASPRWHGMRFGVARRFAVHLHLLDPRCEVPPPDALPERHRRLPPYIYSAEEIAALMAEARRLRPAFRAATAETVIGLLAVTGMRSGEVVRLNRSDVDLAARTLRVVATKRNKSTRAAPFTRAPPRRWPATPGCERTPSRLPARRASSSRAPASG